MARTSRFRNLLAAFAGLALLMIWACHLDQEVRTEIYFDLSKYTDTLDEFDSIRVEFLDTDGNPVDSAFRTKDIKAGTLAEMPIPHYQGDSLKIRIFGWKYDRLVYDMELGFDGVEGHVHTRKALVLPGSKLQTKLLDTTLTVGDSATLPNCTVTPPELADPRWEWISLDPARIDIRAGYFIALSPGEGRLQVRLTNDTSKSAILTVSIREIPVIDTVTRVAVEFQLTRLDILLGDTAFLPEIKVTPAKVSQAVDFRLVVSAHVKLVGTRLVAVSEGDAELIASSHIKPDAADTLPIRVRRPAVAALGLLPDTVRLYTGGKRETLHVKVEPPLAVQEVKWRVSDTTLATLFTDGVLVARRPGRTYVTAFSAGDSTRLDSSIVLVKRDMPQLIVGRDTAISAGGQAVFLVACTQEFGEVVEFRTDLDGDSAFEKSYDEPRRIFPLELKQRYDKVGDIAARFYVRDSEGNDTVVVRHVKAVLGPVINITSPPHNSYTNKDIIDVEWTVNDLPQSDSTREPLKIEGKNEVIRTAKDAAGKVFQASITIYRDQTPPAKPLIAGPSLTRDRTPTWTWKPAEGGGAFRYRVDTADLVGAPIIKDTAFNPPFAISEGKHLFYLQERDIAGNWSGLASFETEIDMTPPKNPAVVSAKALTNTNRPVWTWSQVGGGTGTYRHKLDDSVFISGFIETAEKEFKPAVDLVEGSHTLYVQERDAAGNWSESGKYALTVDITPPGIPTVSGESGGLKPKWTWKSGGGGTGWYRYKRDDTALAVGTTATTDTAYLEATKLPSGQHILFVQEQDAAGNWSKSGSATVITFLPDNSLSDQEISEGFELLFDGTLASFDSNFADYIKGNSSNTTLSPSWIVDSGSIRTTLPTQSDIRSTKTYGDFDLRLDFRNSANQGIFYRFLVDENLPWETGVEYAIEDNLGITNKKAAAGAAYDLYAPSQVTYQKFSTGTWNSARIVVIGDSVEHWMNGVKLLGYTYHSTEFWAVVNASKFNTVPHFTQSVSGDRSSAPIRQGYIGFEGDHGGKWQIRNLRINSTSPKFGSP